LKPARGAGPALALLCLAWAQSGCDRSRPGSAGAQATAAPWFLEITREAGLDFIHDAGTPGSYFMPEVLGSGAALFDFDGDGRLDLYLIQNGGAGSSSRNRLYRQGPGGRLVDVSRGSGLDVAGRGMGAAVGDINNDGRPDLLLTEYGGARLFLNQGQGRFADVTREAGLDNPAWGTSAAFFDFDRDGWLDLVIANYVVYSPTRPCSDQGGKRDYCGPAPFPGTVARLFRNRTGDPAAKGGPRVSFEDVTVPSGLGSLPGPGLGVICADFDGDRWPDILVANDGKPNHLWMNQRQGTFREEALLRGLATNAMGKAEANMGIALGDVDGDGLFDLYVTHLTDELHALWQQGPRGQFSERTAAAGLAATAWRSTGFGAVMGDFDQDGALDIAQVNGRVKFSSGPSVPPAPFFDVYRERNQLFSGDGRGGFRDLSPTNGPFSGRAEVARSLAVGDFDNDGALDLLVTTVAGPARLFRNAVPRRGHWLLVRAVDPRLGGRDAYGAEVAVRAGGRRRVAWLTPSQSYLASSDPRLHFGLGAADRVEEIEVIWPDGSEESFPGQSADRSLVLPKGSGRSLGAVAR
jgi:hypothetical protein